MNYQPGYRSTMTEPSLMGTDEGMLGKQREPRTIIEMLSIVREDAFRLEKQIEELNVILQPILRLDSNIKRHEEPEQPVNTSSEMFNAVSSVHVLLRTLSEKVDSISSRVQL